MCCRLFRHLIKQKGRWTFLVENIDMSYWILCQVGAWGIWYLCILNHFDMSKCIHTSLQCYSVQYIYIYLITRLSLSTCVCVCVCLCPSRFMEFMYVLKSRLRFHAGRLVRKGCMWLQARPPRLPKGARISGTSQIAFRVTRRCVWHPHFGKGFLFEHLFYWCFPCWCVVCVFFRNIETSSILGLNCKLSRLSLC